MGSNKPQSVLNMIKYLAQNDIDPASRNFFSAFLSVRNGSQPVRRTIGRIASARPKATEEHIAWLLFASLQYVSNYAYDELAYADLSTLAGTLMRDLELHQDDITRLCTTKYICTNVINRYAALQVALALMHGNSQVRVLDIGCSVGLGLMSLNTDQVWPIEVADRLLAKALHTKIAFQSLVGLDIQEPDLNWLCACYFPQYRTLRSELKKTYEHLRASGQRFDFVQADALGLASDTRLAYGSFDVIWISNACYQVEGELDNVIGAIRSLLKKNGVWLYAYYRKAQPGYRAKATNEPNPYVIGLYPGGTRQEYLEVLQSDNDEVSFLTRGRDFDVFYRDFTR